MSDCFFLSDLGAIATMVVIFGRVGQTFKDPYTLTVEFPNASGLLRDSDVLLSGARIGRVGASPKLVGQSFAVEVPLIIRGDVKIPRTSSFLVGSSGLLGDRYVDVIPPANFDPADMAAPG